MKHWNTSVAFGLSLIMGISLAGCGPAALVTEEESAEVTSVDVDTEENSVEEDAKGKTEELLSNTHVLVFKDSDNPFGRLLYQGFEEYMEQKGEKTAFYSPDEATPEAQIAVLDSLIEQGAASITLSAAGSEGYEEVLKRADEAGIPVITVDSKVEPEQTICHVDQAMASDVGSYLVQSAVLIALQKEYPGEERMETSVQAALESYSGAEIVLGVLSTTEDSPIQTEWLEAMQTELKKEMYAGKVNREFVIKYGADESADSKVQTGAFLREGIVDCIIAPTTVGMAAAAEVLKDNQSDVRLTGLGLPSLMQQYMPVSEDEDSFAYHCPYMILWDVPHLGATAAAAVYATVYEGFEGEAGESFEMDAFRDYDVTIYYAYTSGKGTGVLAGVPIVFYKGNVAEWMDVL